MIQCSENPDYNELVNTDHNELVNTDYEKLLTNCNDIDLFQIVNIADSTDFYKILNNFHSNPKSLMISALSYYYEKPSTKTANKNTERQTSSENNPKGTIAPYTAANFYKIHKKGIRNFLKSTGLTKRHFKTSVNGVLPEKPIAISTGFALPGRHTILMTSELGTTFVLGITVIDKLMKPTDGIIFIKGKNREKVKVVSSKTKETKFFKRAPLKKTLCTNCKKCEKACPVSAIKDGKVNQDICIQSLCSKDRVLPIQVMKNWGTRFFGCSTCQDICPLNSKRMISKKSLPSTGYAGFEVSLFEILSKTPEIVHDSFKGNQIGAQWVEADALHRNALLALIHSQNQKDKENLCKIQKVLRKFQTSDKDSLSLIANYGVKE